MIKSHQQKLQKILKNRLAKILFIPDCHFPYEDKKAWNLMLNVAKDFKPDVIVILGDFLDLYSISSHQKDLKKRPSFEEEIESGKAALSQLDALGASIKIYIEGNHCWRLDRALNSEESRNKLLPLIQAGAVKIQRISDLLQLPKRNWHFVQYKDFYRLGKLYLTHDVGKAGASAHLDAERTFEGSICIGHTHRFTQAIVGNMARKSHSATSFGWLGNVDEIDYMFKARALKDWQLGFGVGFMSENDFVYVNPVPIIDYTCVVNGKLFK